MNQNQEQQINIGLGEKEAEGIYSNLAIYLSFRRPKGGEIPYIALIPHISHGISPRK